MKLGVRFPDAPYAAVEAPRLAEQSWSQAEPPHSSSSSRELQLTGVNDCFYFFPHDVTFCRNSAPILFV